MTIRPIKGAENSIADALSRIGFQVSQDPSETCVNTVDLNHGFDMKTAQCSDAEVAQLIAWIENNQKPEKIQKRCDHVTQVRLTTVHIEKGILIVWTPPHSPVTQQIVPRILLRQSIIREMHEGKYSGQTGDHKTKESIWNSSIGLGCQKMSRCIVKPGDPWYQSYSTSAANPNTVVQENYCSKREPILSDYRWCLYKENSAICSMQTGCSNH